VTAVDYVTEQAITASGNGHVVALKVSKARVHNDKSGRISAPEYLERKNKTQRIWT